MKILGIDRKYWSGCAVMIGLAGPLEARAQCADDMGCKGDRICVNGECVDPEQPAAAQASPEAKPAGGVLTEVQRLQVSQARTKSTTGLVLGGGTLLMGAATAATNGSDTAPKVLGGLTLALAGVATPFAAAGGAQARRLGRARGHTMKATSSTVVAWTGYGVCMGLGTAVFAAGLSDQEISNGLILSLTALGSLSSLTMYLDTRSAIQTVEAGEQTASSRQRIRPEAHFAAAVTADGASVGLAGRF